MSTTLKRYTDLKERADNARQRASKAQAIYEDRMDKLKKEHGCSTIKQAKAKLKKVQAECDTLEAELASAMDKFEEDWNEHLED